MTSGVTMATIFFFPPLFHWTTRTEVSLDAVPDFPQVSPSAPKYQAGTKQNSRPQDWSPFLFCFVSQLCFTGIYMCLDINLVLFLFFCTMARKQKLSFLSIFYFTVRQRVQNQQTHPELKIPIFRNKRMFSSLMYQHALLERDAHISFPEANKEQKPLVYYRDAGCEIGVYLQ